MSEITIALPFSINSLGEINTTTDQKKIWADRVRSAIGTALRERVMRPSFGTAVTSAIFEGADQAAEEVDSEIRLAFARLLQLLRLEQTNITTDSTTGEITVEVIYKLPNEEVVDTSVIIGRVILTGANPIFEELL